MLPVGRSSCHAVASTPPVLLLPGLEHTHDLAWLGGDLVLHVPPHGLGIVTIRKLNVIVPEQKRRHVPKLGIRQSLAGALAGADRERREGAPVEDELRPRVPPLRYELVWARERRLNCPTQGQHFDF